MDIILLSLKPFIIIIPSFQLNQSRPPKTKKAGDG